MERAISKFALLVFLNLILTVYETRAENPRSALFKIDGHLSEKVFSELFLFEVQAYTNYKGCILLCLGNDACSAVTVTSSALTSPVTCRGHGSPGQKLTTQSSRVADPDTVFYKMSESCATLSECSSWLDEGCSLDSDCGVVNARCYFGQCACKPFYYYSEGEDSCLEKPPWLNTACSLDSDCGVVNAECVTGQCVCRPDYFYSESEDTCVASCSEADLQSNYLMYYYYDFFGYDLTNAYCSLAMTDQECELECQRLCNVYGPSTCYNVLMLYPLKKCHFKVTFTSVHNLNPDGNAVFMKRTCA